MKLDFFPGESSYGKMVLFIIGRNLPRFRKQEVDLKNYWKYIYFLLPVACVMWGRERWQPQEGNPLFFSIYLCLQGKHLRYLRVMKLCYKALYSMDTDVQSVSQSSVKLCLRFTSPTRCGR